jgi:hypothetical protein
VRRPIRPGGCLFRWIGNAAMAAKPPRMPAAVPDPCQAFATLQPYPPALAEKIAAVRGVSFDDELRRETDPEYVESRLRGALFSFRDPRDFEGARVLDFGCGAGSSTVVLARLCCPAHRLSASS